jgi:hypothetical protein
VCESASLHKVYFQNSKLKDRNKIKNKEKNERWNS